MASERVHWRCQMQMAGLWDLVWEPLVSQEQLGMVHLPAAAEWQCCQCLLVTSLLVGGWKRCSEPAAQRHELAMQYDLAFYHASAQAPTGSGRSALALLPVKKVVAARQPGTGSLCRYAC